MANHVFLVEDHPISRRGLEAILDAELDLKVCGEAGTAAEARDKIPEADPDLVLVDLSLATGSGLELIKNLQNRRPELPLLVVSMHDEVLYALRCVRAGARGYVMKRRASETLLDAVRQVLDGRIYLSEEMKKRVNQGLEERSEAPVESPLDALSDRELQIFECLGDGLKTSEIAEQIHLSPKTVSSHQSRIKNKLGIDSTPKLRRWAAIWVEAGYTAEAVDATS
jgi:DNA-binding NarL/FixJ family response regulator